MTPWAGELKRKTKRNGELLKFGSVNVIVPRPGFAASKLMLAPVFTVFVWMNLPALLVSTRTLDTVAPLVVNRPTRVMPPLMELPATIKAKLVLLRKAGATLPFATASPQSIAPPLVLRILIRDESTI